MTYDIIVADYTSADVRARKKNPPTGIEFPECSSAFETPPFPKAMCELLKAFSLTEIGGMQPDRATKAQSGLICTAM